eukprot:6184262-Pleurochrysis_carterae.AAC.2
MSVIGRQQEEACRVDRGLRRVPMRTTSAASRCACGGLRDPWSLLDHSESKGRLEAKDQALLVPTRRCAPAEAERKRHRMATCGFGSPPLRNPWQAEEHRMIPSKAQSAR